MNVLFFLLVALLNVILNLRPNFVYYVFLFTQLDHFKSLFLQHSLFGRLLALLVLDLIVEYCDPFMVYLVALMVHLDSAILLLLLFIVVQFDLRHQTVALSVKAQVHLHCVPLQLIDPIDHLSLS